MPAEITVAAHAGFCFGVRRATERLESLLASAAQNERIYTLGNLIHNEIYMSGLRARGVKTTDEAELPALASDASETSPVTVIVRAHGVTRETEEQLSALARENRYFKYENCTCPYVERIHKIIAENSKPDTFLIMLGTQEHPECVGSMSWCAGDGCVIKNSEALDSLLEKLKGDEFVNLHKKTPILAAQTTANIVEWHKCEKKIKKLYTKAIIFDTICRVTQERQTEAEELARRCDAMVVIGGSDSSNTARLYELCLSECANTQRVGSAEQLDFSALSGCASIGIAAGASTPGHIIQEVLKTMSQTEIKGENFEEMLESSLKTLNTGDTVTGYVTQVTDAELQLDVGTKVTGIIKAEQISDDPAFKMSENFKVGDAVEAFVIRVSDIEGVAELSKKRVDSDRNMKKVQEAVNSEEILEGRVVEVVKGGVVVSVGGVRVFVPASQTGVPKDGDLMTLDKKTVRLRIIEVRNQERDERHRGGKKIFGSIRLVESEERRAKEADFWENLQVGQFYTGKIRSMTSYGAFVDLGSGVDGMVHATELSWKHIKSPADVVSVGDEITVFVKSFDPEKKRISLGYKTEDTNPWYVFTHNFAVGDVASVKIVSMMPFGAFAEIVDGVDGLIHISQIAQTRISQPSDVLEMGQIVDAKIIEINEDKKNVSLSIRALLDEADAAAEQQYADAEQYAETEPTADDGYYAEAEQPLSGDDNKAE